MDSHGNLSRCRNHFSQLFNVHRVNYLRQTEIHTAEPMVPQPSAFESDMAIGKRKKHQLPGTDQIPVELIKSGGRTFRSDIHKLISSIQNMGEMPQEWKKSIIIPIYKKGDKTNCSNYRGISLCQVHTKFLPHPAVKVNSISR